jgi:putative salt-induced outer membrane protein YdiY
MNKPTSKGNWLGVGAGVLLAASTVVPVRAQSQPQQTVAAMPAKKPTWEATAALGVTVTSGNSDTMLFNAMVRGIKKWAKNELGLGFDGTYGENDGDKNNEQIKGFGQYNRIFGQEDRWFGYGRLDALHDGIAGVEGRISLSPGVGYYFIKNAKSSLSGEVGPGFVEEKLGDDSWEQYMTLRVAERFEHKINDRSKLWQSAQWQPQMDDFDNYLLNAEVGLSTAITPKWDLRVVVQNAYDNQPAPGRKSNDLKIVAGVGFKFL